MEDTTKKPNSDQVDETKAERPAQTLTSSGHDEARAEEPSTSKGPAKSFRAHSLEEVDLMTDDEIKLARLSGASKRRLQFLVKGGRDYTEAKRSVIKENLSRHLSGQDKAKTRPQSAKPRHQGQMEEGQVGKTNAPKRPRQDAVTPPSAQMRKKRAKLEELSFKDALTAVRVAVVAEGYPAERMEPDRLVAVQTSIMEAYEGIPVEGPQVRFAKCTHRPGYLLVACADAVSAEWLRTVVPTLRPWQGASLKALEGDDLPGLHACTVFVPDENGQRLEADKILIRLRVGNKALTTNLWTVLGKTPADRGQLWTFSMDKQSMDELKKLEMCPYFGMGRIKFRPKEQGAKPGTRGVETAKKPQNPPLTGQPPKDRPVASGVRRRKKGARAEPDPKDSGPSTQGGQSPLKRHSAQERTMDIEMEGAAGESQTTQGSSQPETK